MHSTINFNTKLKEAASFGQPITEYDPGSRGYKDFVNLARELMGHRPLDVEPITSDKLSRPAELVQRAKQLAQMTTMQFGRTSVPSPATAAAVEEPSGGVAVAEAPAPTATARTRPTVAPAMEMSADARERVIEQKIKDFYGVRQVGRDVVFAVRFEQAHRVALAGDFNGWSPDATVMLPGKRTGEFRMALPLNPGRYRYRLVVDGKWITDPNNQYVEINQFGELNNIVEVE
jgi:hypothetical protein